MQKYILLDRDGVINIEKDYLHKIEDFEYEKEVINGLIKLKNMGYKFIIITNQSGIARGYYSEEEYYNLEKYMVNDLRKKGIEIDKVYYCPHHPEGIGKYKKDCDCRKPKKGNFIKAINEFNIDIEKSFMIGDRITDLIPAAELGIKTVLVTTGYGLQSKEKLQENRLNCIIVENILQFATNLS